MLSLATLVRSLFLSVPHPNEQHTEFVLLSQQDYEEPLTEEVECTMNPGDDFILVHQLGVSAVPKPSIEDSLEPGGPTYHHLYPPSLLHTYHHLYPPSLLPTTGVFPNPQCTCRGQDLDAPRPASSPAPRPASSPAPRPAPGTSRVGNRLKIMKKRAKVTTMPEHLFIELSDTEVEHVPSSEDDSSGIEAPTLMDRRREQLFGGSSDNTWDVVNGEDVDSRYGSMPGAYYCSDNVNYWSD